MYQKFFEAVWQILIDLAKIEDDPFCKERFIQHGVKSDGDHLEIRFYSPLLPGGKFRHDPVPGYFVDCYWEAETPERLDLIDQINHRIQQSWLETFENQ